MRIHRRVRHAMYRQLQIFSENRIILSVAITSFVFGGLVGCLGSVLVVVWFVSWVG